LNDDLSYGALRPALQDMLEKCVRQLGVISRIDLETALIENVLIVRLASGFNC
jgi:hypothetical protein